MQLIPTFQADWGFVGANGLLTVKFIEQSLVGR